MKPSTIALLADDAQTIQALFDALPGNAVLVKTNAPVYTILAATPNLLKQTGRTKESIIGKGTFEAFPGNNTDAADTGESALKASYNQVLAQKQPHSLPVQRYDMQAEDGSFTEHYWRASNTPVFDSDGDVAYIIHSTEDITHQINAQEQAEKIKGLEQAYGLFMQAPFAIHIFTGPDLIIDLANPPTMELWGKTGNVTGKRFLDVLPELKGQGYDGMMREVMQTGKPRFFYEVPLALNRPGKEPIGYFNFVYQPYYKGGASKVESVLIIANEVTQQVLAKKSIEESEARLNNIVEQTPAPTLVLRGDDYLIEHINTPMLQMMGRGEEVLGQPFLSIMPELEGQYAWTQVQRVYREGISFDVEELLVPHKRTGVMQDYYYNVAYRPLKEDGRIIGMIQVAIDVTEQIKARKNLEESELFNRTALESSPDCVKVLDIEGRLTYMNFNGTCIMEIDDFSSLKGKWWWDLWPDDSKDDVRGAITKALKGQTAQFQAFCPTAKGTPKWWDVLVSPIASSDGSVCQIISVSRDVTEKRKAGQALKESEERFRALVNATSDVIYRMSADWTEMRNLEGRGFLTDTGEPIKDWIEKYIHPKDSEGVSTAIANAIAGKSIFELEHQVLRADGSLGWTFSRAIPILGNNDDIIEWFGAASDVTERKKAENAVKESESRYKTLSESLEQQVDERTKEVAGANETLRLMNKELQRSNANLEEFAHAASHDLKEPVRKIHFFTNQLKEQLSAQLQEGQAKAFGRIENATERMGNLIDDLLLYSHVSQRPHEMESIDLNQKMQRVLEDLELDIEEKGAIINIGKLPVVKGYRRQLQQLFQNLISNALKYSQAGVPPQISITAGKTEVDGKPWHQIEVRDNGIGFDQQYAEKIFQMFARLHGKSEYSGTGVGLSIAKKVVENHGGAIQVESAPGQGTTFRVLLPE